MTKKNNEIYHFKNRLAERFGIYPSNKLYNHIVRLIQKGHSKFHKRQSRRITLHDIPLNGLWLRIVYDTKRKNPVTFLGTQRRETTDDNSKRFRQYNNAIHII